MGHVSQTKLSLDTFIPAAVSRTGHQDLCLLSTGPQAQSALFCLHTYTVSTLATEPSPSPFTDMLACCVCTETEDSFQCHPQEYHSFSFFRFVFIVYKFVCVSALGVQGVESEGTLEEGSRSPRTVLQMFVLGTPL